MPAHLGVEAAGAEIVARAQVLAQVSEAPDLLLRSYLTEAHRAAGQQLLRWMRAAGMEATVDAVGNVVGRYEGRQPGLPALLTGSHFDTVRNAGKYDGILGILTAIACVEALHAAGERLPFAVEVIGFAEEEGVRFQSTLLGSRALAGTFDGSVLDKRDGAGITLDAALRRYGLDPARIAEARRSPDRVLAYLEVHIEQGPVLLAEDLPVGIVTAISGATRLSVAVTGEGGHAGTVPMGLRRDAAAAAAEMVLCVERRCQGHPSLVGTVGELTVPHGATNVIAGRVEFSLDIRAADDAVRQAALADVLAELDAVARRRGVTLEITPTHDAPAVPCAPWLMAQLEEAVVRAGLAVRRLPSGAGHDAMALASLTDVAMLFVRCGNGGISHHPRETVSAEDAGRGAVVLLDVLRRFRPRGRPAPRSGHDGAPQRIRVFLDREHPAQAAFLAELVRVPTDNPPGDTARHAEVAAGWLARLGLPVERHPVPEATVREAGMVSVTNLVVRHRFGAGPTIALNAHGDVVPPGAGWRHDPYGAAVADGKLYGRGAAVSKSDFATYTYALLALQACGARLAGAVELHFTYDEEVGGDLGPRWLLDRGVTRPDYVIAAGFSYGVVTAHNGCLHLEVIVRGRQAHAALPHTGVDALEAASGILRDLYGYRAALTRQRSQVSGIGSPTLNVGLIGGGINTNVVPDRVTFRIDRRLIPEEAAGEVEAELTALIRDAARGYPEVGCEVRRILLAEPLAPVPGHERLLSLLSRHGTRIMGEPVMPHGVPLYTDARHYAKAGIPTVLYGAGPRDILEAGAHGADEHVRLSDLRRATEVVALTLLELLGGDG